MFDEEKCKKCLEDDIWDFDCCCINHYGLEDCQTCGMCELREDLVKCIYCGQLHCSDCKDIHKH